MESRTFSKYLQKGVRQMTGWLDNVDLFLWRATGLVVEEWKLRTGASNFALAKFCLALSVFCVLATVGSFLLVAREAKVVFVLIVIGAGMVFSSVSDYHAIKRAEKEAKAMAGGDASPPTLQQIGRAHV